MAETPCVSGCSTSGPVWTVLATRQGPAGRDPGGEVFVCGGAVQTPLLLRRSGITKNILETLWPSIRPVKAVAMFERRVNHEELGFPFTK